VKGFGETVQSGDTSLRFGGAGQKVWPKRQQ
jgi:hypothetical protein